MNFKFKGCNVSIKNESNLVSDAQCNKFLRKYISHLFAEQTSGYDDFYYKHPLLEKKKDVIFRVKNNSNKISIYINDTIDIVLSVNGFHNAQLEGELHTSVQASFFLQIHQENVNGIEIMNY